MKKRSTGLISLAVIVLLCGVAFFLCRRETLSEQYTENNGEKVLFAEGESIGGEKTADNEKSLGVSRESMSISGFIHVDGEELVDEEGNVFRIKGMGFGNNVWQNPSEPTETHHDEESYRELSELGFNAVRFYLNYRIFEDDEMPYVYKEEAFVWLDENIKWAGEHGIRLILNMHLPPGGFISSKNVQFWEKEENISRYIALWTEIARRYADEPSVLGYGLMNEPFLPDKNSAADVLSMYYDLMEKVAHEIRKVDSRHILFVERPYGIVDTEKNVSYAWGDTGSFRCISDPNVVYEFHFYEYTNFTSQGISWSSFERDWYYGDDSIALLSGKRNYFAICKENSLKGYETDCGGWQLIESPLYDMTRYGAADAAYVLLDFSDLSKNAKVYIDDIVVTEYNSEGQAVREIYRYSFDDITACSGWDLGEGTGGRCMYTRDAGHDAYGCELILDAGGRFRLYKNDNIYNYFPIKEGYKYQVSFWLKVEDGTSVSVQPGLQLLDVERVYSLNKEFLERKLSTYVSHGKEQDVPIYIGEFGTTFHVMGNEFNGEMWVSDVFDVLNQYELHYSYHDYHEENYGLYCNSATEKRGNLNEYLLQVFERKVKE